MVIDGVCAAFTPAAIAIGHEGVSALAGNRFGFQRHGDLLYLMRNSFFIRVTGKAISLCHFDDVLVSGSRRQIAVRSPDQLTVSSAYPNSPHPKDAVHRMENTTNPIIHISSFFMGNASLTV
jgi:hypothetical protein